MKRKIQIQGFLLAGWLFFCVIGVAQQPAIIPQPASLQIGKGSFCLSKNTVIAARDEQDKKAAAFFNHYLLQVYGFALPVQEQSPEKNYLQLFTRKFIKAPEKDAYSLAIVKEGIRIDGDTYAGTFYGIQTLLQLLPVSFQAHATNPQLSLPFISIQDAPRFPYRGMHLDVSRHFFPASFLKKYIDYLALHKMNFFHLHLTDDQGWRIEIKKYPLLTQKGGCRNGTIIGRYPGIGNDRLRYCGYYTQQELRDLVRYAADRYITIIPEIEMPGHSSAALASYPWLGCPGTGPYQVQETWGVFTDVYCAGKDSTFQFLQQVLDEVMDIFPSPYIHIGGDECPKANWKSCPLCQRRIKNEGLKNEQELQSYFIHRIEKYVTSKGRSIVGWDEILEGGLAPNAIVMSWRGEKGGIEAARQQHKVIMTPEPYVYFDQAQKLKEDSVSIGRYLPLEKVYAYEPVPAVLNPGEAKYIIGAQGDVWTEYMKNPQKVEYMIFPRMSALSEVLWTPKEKRNWPDFEKRLPAQLKRYTLWQANFSSAYYDIQAELSPTPSYNGIFVQLQTNEPDVPIRYSLSGNPAAKVYTRPIMLTESTTIKAFKSKGFPDTLKMQVQINKATGRKITLSPEPLQGYQGSGPFTLVDGIINEMGLSRSGELLGFRGKNAEAVIDLGRMQPVSKVVVHTLHSGGSRIYPARAVEVYGAADNKIFNLIASSAVYTMVNPLKGRIVVSFSPVSTRFIKVIVQPLAKIPEGRPGAGENPLYFLDEIEVH